jgi:polysaccharide biosynthesis/export protein
MQLRSTTIRTLIAVSLTLTAVLAIALAQRDEPAKLTPPQEAKHRAANIELVQCMAPLAEQQPQPLAAQTCAAGSYTSNASPYPIWGVDSLAGRGRGEVGWDSRGFIDWQNFAQGEWVGHARIAQVPEYRLRADDQLSIYFLRTREVIATPYRLQVGDRFRVESLTAGTSSSPGSTSSPASGGEDSLNREVEVQPDGTITLPLVGRVLVAGRSLEAVNADLEQRFKEYYKNPEITVSPVVTNTILEDLLDTVGFSRGIQGGRRIETRVTPSGHLQLPRLGDVLVQGLSLAEAKAEIDARYRQVSPGISVTVVLEQRAPRFVYVLGQVNQAGRFEMQGPTTVNMAISLAQGWRLGANLRQVVVFRRGPDWRLMATMVDVQGALYARRPVPADDIWLNDSDIVLVPKNALQIADDVIEQVFTRGVYGVVPEQVIWGNNFNGGTSL